MSEQDNDAALSEQVANLQRQLQEAQEQIHGLERALEEARNPGGGGGGEPVHDADGRSIGAGGFSNVRKDTYPGGAHEKPMTNAEIREAIENYMTNSISITGGGGIDVVKNGLQWSVSAAKKDE